MTAYFKIFGVFLIILISSMGYGQENRVQLMGKVQSFSKDISDVLIVNIHTKKSTITDAKGFFTLDVTVKDTIQFSGVHYRTEQIVVTDTILNQKMILVDLK